MPFSGSAGLLVSGRRRGLVRTGSRVGLGIGRGWGWSHWRSFGRLRRGRGWNRGGWRGSGCRRNGRGVLEVLVAAGFSGSRRRASLRLLFICRHGRFFWKSSSPALASLRPACGISTSGSRCGCGRLGRGEGGNDRRRAQTLLQRALLIGLLYIEPGEHQREREENATEVNASWFVARSWSGLRKGSPSCRRRRPRPALHSSGAA